MQPRKKSPSGAAVPEAASVSEQTYLAIRSDILSGALAAGQPLRLDFLRERYRASYSPLREALSRMQVERLVVFTASKGFKVAPLSEDEMWDAIESRVLVDCQALKRSIERGGDEWKVGLVAAAYALELETGRSESRDADKLETAHRNFHFALISACESEWLLSFSEQLYNQTERYRRPFLLAGADTKRDLEKEHASLLEATLAKDAERATALLKAHYFASGNSIIESFLSKKETEPIA